MQSKAATVQEYLAELPEERRTALEAVRRVIRNNLPEGYEEGMQYGMIGYYVPHSVYPSGYHCDPSQPVPFASLASQKNHMALYLMCIYGSPDEERWFREAWSATGKRLDMGKSCVRFKRIEDVPLDVVGQAVRRAPVEQFLARYESSVKGSGGKRPARSKKEAAPTRTTKKKATKKKAAKKSPTISVAGKKASAKRGATQKGGAKKAAASGRRKSV